MSMILNTRMYTHDHLPQPDEAELRRFVLENPFAHVVTASSQAGVHCTAVATVEEPSTGAGPFTLLGHLARRNPHAAALDHADAALLLFAGPHHYISPSWYASREAVPTWNYIDVQARGSLEVIDDREGTEEVLRRTIERMERDATTPWTLEMAPRAYIERLLPQIRAFRIRVVKLEGTFKLNQNRSQADRKGVVEALRARRDGDALEIARLMEQAQQAR